jgi:hypothetical protein
MAVEAFMGTAPGFFDVDDRLRRLSDLGDQLEAYGRVVDFERSGLILEGRLPIRTGRTAADRPTTRS